ncbi:E3 ubiquitin- ligase CCNB1IP1 [Lecanosticta acicola]|uniref:E3 ubiquitin- ligase CCNB1IP1 n=1 Tax=Lecanosticta acicola TaxID=111012 RepID=A0AAI8YVR3_9PEZI|nr:E3 ubiquitin- ligase CCNB1IP1 [Lecanosticta acicola]
MDTSLHCNDLKCRAIVDDRAVVTTCSHIFCLHCADRLNLTAPQDGQRKCPACSTYLLNPDDAVITLLNPTEDYKTSILSGLSPTVIMECAQRGLSFWAYQVAQEITYQEYLARTLTERYHSLTAHLDSVVREANDENNKLRARLQAMDEDNAALQEKVQSIDAKCKERSKSAQQFENMYRKLKQVQMASGIEVAVEEDAENILQGTQAADGQARASQHQGGGTRTRRNGSTGSGGSENRRPRMNLGPRAGYRDRGYPPPGSRAGLSIAQSAPTISPSQQPRQRLPQQYTKPTFGHYNQSFANGQSIGADPPGYRTESRAGSHDRSPQAGVGMSANIRTSRQPVGTGYAIPPSRNPTFGASRTAGYAGSIPIR